MAFLFPALKTRGSYAFRSPLKARLPRLWMASSFKHRCFCHLSTLLPKRLAYEYLFFSRHISADKSNTHKDSADKSNTHKKWMFIKKFSCCVSGSLSFAFVGNIFTFSCLHHYNIKENDHRSNIEYMESNKRKQDEQIIRLKEENKHLRAQLLGKVCNISEGVVSLSYIQNCALPNGLHNTHLRCLRPAELMAGYVKLAGV